MQKIYLLLFLTFIIFKTNAQYLNLKGFTIQANEVLYIEDDEPVSKPTDHIYVVSLTDKTLVHLIFSGGEISDNQIYRIENNTAVLSGGNSVYKFEALSGVTGNRFYYEVKIDEDGALVSLKLTRSSGSVEVFKGGIFSLKTYKQE